VVGLTVPEGYRYVVQHVSTQGIFPARQRFRVNVFAAGGSFFVRHQLLPMRVFGSGGTSEYVATQPMRIDLDPGVRIRDRVPLAPRLSPTASGLGRTRSSTS
jgi:hypothetical protein